MFSGGGDWEQNKWEPILVDHDITASSEVDRYNGLYATIVRWH